MAAGVMGSPYTWVLDSWVHRHGCYTHMGAGVMGAHTWVLDLWVHTHGC